MRQRKAVSCLHLKRKGGEYIVSSGSKKLKSVEGIAYQKINPYLYAPVNIVSSTQGYADCDTVRCGYDSYGHLIYQEKSGGKGTVFLWGTFVAVSCCKNRECRYCQRKEDYR